MEVSNPFFTKLGTSYRSAVSLYWIFDIDLLKHLIYGEKDISHIYALTDSKNELVKSLLDNAVLLNIIDFNEENQTYSMQESLSSYLSTEYQHVKQELKLHRNQLVKWLSISLDGAEDPLIQRPEREMFTTGEDLQSYLRMVKSANQAHAEALVDFIERKQWFSSKDKSLDIGGGHALYSMLLNQRYPDSHVNVLDLDATVACSKALNVDDQRAKNVNFICGDALKLDNVDHDYSVVFINDLLHSFNFDNKALIVRNALRATGASGILLLSKLRHNITSNKTNNALLSLKLHINSGEGYLESDDEVVEIVKAAGGEIIETVLLTENKVTYAIKKGDVK